MLSYSKQSHKAQRHNDQSINLRLILQPSPWCKSYNIQLSQFYQILEESTKHL